LKANHNGVEIDKQRRVAVLNFVKKQIESKSQHMQVLDWDQMAVLNFVKKQIESKSQLYSLFIVSSNCCFKLCQKTN
jgi:hypothetical protein